MVIMIEILFAALGALLIFIGYKFRKGEWLNLIAGNIFHDDDAGAKKVAPVVGIIAYLSGLTVILFDLYIIFILN